MFSAWNMKETAQRTCTGENNWQHVSICPAVSPKIALHGLSQKAPDVTARTTSIEAKQAKLMKENQERVAPFSKQPCIHPNVVKSSKVHLSATSLKATGSFSILWRRIKKELPRLQNNLLFIQMWSNHSKPNYLQPLQKLSAHRPSRFLPASGTSKISFTREKTSRTFIISLQSSHRKQLLVSSRNMMSSENPSSLKNSMNWKLGRARCSI